MVKVGFIVEGDSEKVLLESKAFRQWCEKNGISIVSPIINAGGGGNLLPKYLANHVKRLSAKERPDKIVVLTDKEKAPTDKIIQDWLLSVNKNKEKKTYIDAVFVSVKALEAWFLADDEAMSSWLKERFHEDFPERTHGTPWERIRKIASERDRGLGKSSHVVFARTIINAHGFSIERAANHPQCSSARTFCNKLREWGNE